MKRPMVALLSFIVPVAAFVIVAATAVGDADAKAAKKAPGKKAGGGDPPTVLYCSVGGEIPIPPGDDGAAALLDCIDRGGHPEGTN